MNKNYITGFQKESVGIGRRKQSTARVFIYPGNGELIINNVLGKEYFQSNSGYLLNILKPLKILNLDNKYDIIVLTNGGGLTGQADSIRLGLSRLLCQINPSYRLLLKQNKFLSRDPRVKERKKYGLKKARKAPRYSKR